MAKTTTAEGIYFYHTVGIRIRVTGSGNLRVSLNNLALTNSQTLAPKTMSASTDIIPTILANFRSQKVQVEIKTTGINEHFIIGEIVIFQKPSGLSSPVL